jgi:NADH dehydrogenase
MKDKILVTGANGNLGKKFILSKGEVNVCALVRSEKAKDDLMSFIKANDIQDVQIVKCDYLDEQAIKELAKSCSYLLHLVGIIRENKDNRFNVVHKQTTKVLMEAIKGSGIKKCCYISILGAKEDSINACFSSRGFAEKLFLDSYIPSLVLQVPMVLGEGDYASEALKKNALSRINFTFRKLSLEQPIYAQDIIDVVNIDIKRALEEDHSPSGIKTLAGPTSLTRERLIEKTAKQLGVKVKVFSLPLFLGYTLAKICEMLVSKPPITQAMLGVLDHDDDIDPLPSSKELGINLTTLDEMLEATMSA